MRVKKIGIPFGDYGPCHYGNYEDRKNNAQERCYVMYSPRFGPRHAVNFVLNLNLENAVNYPNISKHSLRSHTPNIISIIAIAVKPNYRTKMTYPWACDFIFIIIKWLHSVQYSIGHTSPSQYIEICSPPM